MNYCTATDLTCVDEIVDIHMATFQSFFLTFLGRGFLRQLYKGFITHEESNIIIARDDRVEGFLAYSNDLSGFYKYLIRKSLFPFAWYSIIATFKNPKTVVRLIRAFVKPSESKRTEQYVELSSIGVRPEMKGKGIGSRLIDELKVVFDRGRYAYIKLETDAVGNDDVNRFYMRNGFAVFVNYTTVEGRKMNEYRWEPNES